LGLLIFLVMRILTAVTAYTANTAYPRPYPTFPDGVIELRTETFITQGALRAWLDPWYRYDTGWYLYIAHEGYSPDSPSIIFAPLYPLLVRLISVLTWGDYLVAGLLVSSLAALLTLILLYKLIAEELGGRLAALALVLYATFPTAFYLVAAYTESTFMALALGAWLAVCHKRYWLAGILAFLAALTRAQGWALALPFAYIILERESQPHGGLSNGIRYFLTHPLVALRVGLPSVLTVLGGPLGTAAYVFGMELAGMGSVEAAFTRAPWNVYVQLPWDTILSAARVLLEGSAKINDLASIAVFILIVVTGILALRLLKPPYWLLVFPTLFFILLRGHDTFQFHGILRYALYMFPTFMVLALLLKNQDKRAIRLITGIIIVLGITLQLALVAAFSLWGWVS
jgi:hypothetical protein